MGTRASLQGVAIRVFAVVIFLAIFGSLDSVTAQPCPLIRDSKGTSDLSDDLVEELKKNAAGECAITSRLDTENPLTLTSNTTLNCQTHRIEPKFNPVTERKPDVAIFLNGAQNVKIKNCRIENFDFGIFAINSKRDPDSNAPPIQIVNNDIKGRFVGISLMSVDSSEIRGNRLGSDTKGGRAIYVGRDSDRNRILNNEITLRIPTGDTTPGFRVPGSQFTETLPSNLPLAEGSAVLITQTEGNEPSLLNAIIVDTTRGACGLQNRKCFFLFQLTVIDAATPNGFFTDGNVVDGNIISIQPSTLSVDGISLAIPQRTIVSNNKVIRAKNSIRVGAQTGPPLVGFSPPKQFPGTCAAKPSRFCLGKSDCNIPGFETNTDDNCNLLPPKPLFWVSNNTIIQDNVIIGPFGIITNPSVLGGAGIATTGVDTIIAGNIIEGNNGTSVGIRLVGKFGLETTTVTKNSITDVDIALSFIQDLQVAPEVFSAKISLNDFARYSTAVKVSRTPQPDALAFYDLRSSGLEFSELSFESKGNNWGLTCLQGGFDPNKVRNSDPLAGSPPGSVSAFVKDSHPFQNRVSNTSFLTPCR